MARQKKQTVTGYDRPVAAMEDGTQQWQAGGLTFVFDGRVRGINVAVHLDGRFHPAVYARNLAEAGFWAEGFVCGMAAGKSRAKADAADKSESE